jgi:hypothetical protein
MWVVSKKAYRFTNPHLADDYVDVLPHRNISRGPYGDPQSIPLWAAQNPMFKLAMAVRDIEVVNGPQDYRSN